VGLGVHGVQRDDPEPVAELQQFLAPHLPRHLVLRLRSDVDDVLDDHRPVSVVLGEPEHVEHQQPGPQCGVVGQRVLEQTLLDRGQWAGAVGLRPLGALR
jgi:hypothetical protein